MGFLDNFPYTNFHELNLDWILNKLKELATEWSSYYENTEKWKNDMDAAFQDLKIYVEDYFDNLDVTQEVYDKMEEFAQDGTLQSIMQQVVDTSQNMDLAPVACVPAYRGHTDLDNEAAYPNWFQSGCSDGTYLYMFFNNSVQDGAVLIKKYNIASGTLVGSTTITAHHANGAEYYDGKIYLATLDAETGIAVIDPDTLLIENNIITPGYGFRSVSIDNDGTMYAAAGGTLYTIDTDNGNQVHLKCNLQFTNEGYQSGVVRDGWLYEAGVNPSCVYKISVETGLVVHVYPISRYIDFYCVGEVETVFADRAGHYYVGSCSYYPFGNYRFGNVFAADFNTNLQSKRAYAGANVLSIGTVYVDTTRDIMLPDGTSGANAGGKPFTTLGMALMALNSPLDATYKTIAVNLESDVTDEPFYARERHIELAGNGHKVPKIYLANCTSYISNVEVADTITGETGLGVRGVYVSGGHVSMVGVTVSRTRTGADAAIYCNTCTANIFDVTLGSNAVQKISVYRTMVVADATTNALIDNYHYNLPTFSKGPSAAYTALEITRAAQSYGALVTMEKGGKRVTALLPTGASKIVCGFVYISGKLEEWDGTLTYNANTGYTFTASAWIINSISGGTVSRTSTDAPTCQNVVFLGH